MLCVAGAQGKDKKDEDRGGQDGEDQDTALAEDGQAGETCWVFF